MGKVKILSIKELEELEEQKLKLEKKQSVEEITEEVAVNKA